MSVVGWDLGGAHLKAVRIEDGRAAAAVQLPCPLWQGMDRLQTAFAAARQALGEASLHAVTMTGELSDIFADRAEGVRRIAALAEAELAGEIRFYAGRDGWIAPADLAAHVEAAASANWHATAALLAGRVGEALLIDTGSTTTDIIPIRGGCLAGRGYTDAERLAAGELVYTGATRTFLMAIAQRVPFRGEWTPVMNEYFASAADIHRIRGVLPEGVDHLPAADNRDKSLAASCARLARMIGRDAAEAEGWEWRRLAEFFAAAQLRRMEEAALQVLSAAALPDDAPVVAAGTGRFILGDLAARLGRPVRDWEDYVPAAPGLGAALSHCAPAAAVGLLLAAQGSAP